MKTQVQVNMAGSYKLGMDEVVGLREALETTLAPVREAIKNHAYWDDLELESVEYKRRDGFIPHKHNCGGLRLQVTIPKCEEYNFGFLEFGECDECENAATYPEGDHQCGYKGVECGYESEGHLDAHLNIWLKFEGLGDEGELKFYLVMSGGNDDAPYYRTIPTLFEAEFSCKSLKGLKRAASPHIKALLKAVQGE